MRAALLSTMLGAGLLLAPMAYAGTSGVTATCKDGSSFSGTTRTGACRGHKGVATWGAAAGSAAATRSPGMAPAAPPPTHAATAARPRAAIPDKATSEARGSSKSAAAKAGAPGQVWVNSATKIYHCPGDRYYGKTKTGAFMTRSAAEAAGDHPAKGKSCSS